MLRLGIAGIGVIANDYIRLMAGGRTTGIAITALCSRNAENCRKAVEAYGLAEAEVFTDYTAMLASGRVDGVLICTPHPQHPAMTLEALEKGIHVLVEKPVGVDPRQVRQAIERLEQQPSLVCGVMYNRRMSATFRKAKELVECGAIGRLKRASWIITNLYRTDAYYRSSPWRGSWESEGGGLLMTQASHQLDLLQWLCGPPTAVLAHCRTVERSIEVENEATLLLQFAEGGMGQFIASGHETPGSNRLELAGSHGTLTITDDRDISLWTLEQAEDDFARQNNDLFGKPDCHCVTPPTQPDDNLTQQAAMLQNFADAVAGKTAIACTLREGLGSLEIIRGAYASAREGGWQQLAITK